MIQTPIYDLNTRKDVKNVETAPIERGGAGCTIVELK
ncbi:Smr/MutS family protein [Gracilimonas sediminicola]|uniref:Smr/MutS family protein n=1 Tax=Gracilimonas sediminicola TaxID=2952158 RepID=A0A9X2L4Y2_9BACT|nr:Smr/MutS family protein [Gracilimonas sediminicola]MCP9292440.1 Smr/MutS family protein [Gracilimonas sediminicola]